jgi:hypothetical protein
MHHFLRISGHMPIPTILSYQIQIISDEFEINVRPETLFLFLFGRSFR